MKINHSKYNLSNDFIDEIVKSSAGFLSSKEFDKLFELFDAEIGKYNFTRSGESNLLRIIFSLYDKRTFFIDALHYPHFVEIVAAIAFNSNYLSDIVVRNPEFLYQIFNSEYLNRNVTMESLEREIQTGAEKFKSFNSKLNFLKSLKRRYILKLGLLDILFRHEIINVTESLSILAKATSAKLFELCFNETIKKYNADFSSEYCIVALGKLGGNELNYSSDIDLIIFFDKNESNGNSKKDFQEVLSESVHLFVQSSTNITDKGFLYRVDFRLRPDGRNSPLARSLTDYLRYYETRGEDWEKQMLIKQSYCGGSRKLYHQFNDFIESFIYAPLLTSSVIAKVKSMKDNIERQTESALNVKTFRGGIRDIEFSVQALQLIYGSKIKGIRSPNTLDALKLLHKNEILTTAEFEVFTEAYIFYRKIEHYLQLQNDQQTHTIPTDENIVKGLANYLNLPGTENFHSQLEIYRADVRKIYLSIVKYDEAATENEVGSFTAEFTNKSKAEKNLQYLSKGIGLLGQKEFDSRTIKLFEEIKPTIVEKIRTASDPDMVLDNFTKIISRAPLKSIWYSELKNPQFMTAVINICAYSQRAVDLLVQNKKMLDLLLSQQIFRADFFKMDNIGELIKLHLILACNFANKLIGHEEVSKILAGWVINKINRIMTEFNPPENYFLAGLGSLGSSNMGFASDIDLLVISEKIDREGEIQNLFQKILEVLRKEFFPLPVDFRLRPEGKRSQLVWDINGYKDYLQKRILPWEIQALTKIKFIAGNEKLFNEFVTGVIVRMEKFEQDSMLNDVRSIYKKFHAENLSGFNNQINLKKQKGGLFDIDYTIQYLIIRKPEIFKESLGENIENKGEIIKNHYFYKDDISTLVDNYNFLKKSEMAMQNILGVNNSNLPIDEKKQKLLGDYLGIKFEDFISLIINKLNVDQRIIEKILEINKQI